MRIFLIWTVVAEGLLLAGAGLALLLGVDLPGRLPPAAPAFRPRLEQGVIGDRVRYQIRALDDEGREGDVLGYVDYEIRLAKETRGTTFGREFVITIEEEREDGPTVARTVFVRPRQVQHGFLPPRIDEDERPTGALPVVRTIRTAPVRLPWYRDPRAERPEPTVVDGFLLEAVHPRESLTGIRERYWYSDEVLVFGVARWERGDEVLVLHSQQEGGS